MALPHMDRFCLREVKEPVEIGVFVELVKSPKVCKSVRLAEDDWWKI